MRGSGRGSGQARSPTGAPITAAVNRGLPRAPLASEAENLDVLATWWAVLAALPGPVINRPDATGFLPVHEVDACVVATSDMANRAVTAATRERFVCNVHDERTGAFLARWGNAAGLLTAPAVRITPFDPESSWRLVIAGSTVVQVARPRAGVGATERGVAAQVLRKLRRRGSVFASVVLARTPRGFELVAVDILPGPAHYRGHEDRVHAAVVNWLTR